MPGERAVQRGRPGGERLGEREVGALGLLVEADGGVEPSPLRGGDGRRPDLELDGVDHQLGGGLEHFDRHVFVTGECPPFEIGGQGQSVTSGNRGTGQSIVMLVVGHGCGGYLPATRVRGRRPYGGPVRRARSVLLAVVVSGAVAACGSSTSTSPPETTTPVTTSAPVEASQIWSRRWIEEIESFVRSDKPGPPATARIYAYTAASYADAMSASDGQGPRPTR